MPSTPQETSLGERLQKLATRASTQRSDLVKSLGDDLRRIWYVDVTDLPGIATKKVTWQLERLISGLPDPKDRLIARTSYNFDVVTDPENTDTIKIPASHRGTEVSRHNWMVNNKGTWESNKNLILDYSRARKRLRNEIISAFVLSLRSNPPAPAPAEQLSDHAAGPPSPPEPKSSNSAWPKSFDGTQSTAPQEERPPYISPSIVPRDIPFVSRPAYTAEFANRLSRGDQVIPFVGEPGNGKSRLADWLIEQYRQGDESRIDLRANDMASLHTDIKVQLERRGISTSLLLPDQVIEQFALWLCAQDAPDLVFIDNLEDNNLFERLVLRDSHARVIVTSRENRVPAHVATPIAVQAMEPEEAQQLAREILPQHDKADIARLATELGNRPLAIVHASTGLLADGFMTVEHFCRALDEDAASVMQQARTPEEVDRTLTWIYRRTLDRLRQLDRDAGTSIAALLELVAFVAPTDIPAELLIGALSTYRSAKNDASRAALFQVSQRDLCARYLLARDGVGDAATFSIHPLTQTLLQSIIAGEGNALSLCLYLHWPVQWRLRHEQDDTDLWFTSSISADIQRWLPHIYTIARSIVRAIAQGPRYARDGLQKEIEFGHTLAVLIRGFRDAGDSVAAQRAANLHPIIHSPEEWQAAPYLYEAYIESLRLRYDLALLTGSEYEYWLQQAFLCLPESPNAPGKKVPPRPLRMLEYVELLLQNGSCNEALDLISLFDHVYPLNRATPPGVLLYRLMLLGEVYHQQCRWSESEKALTDARRVRDRLGLDEWQFKREDMRALVILVENGLRSGMQDQATEYEHIADAVWADKPEDIIDSLTEARYHYIKGRCALTAFIRAQVAVNRDGTTEDYEACYKLVEQIGAHWAASRSAFARVDSVRDMYRFFGERLTLYFIIGGRPGMKACVDLINEDYDISCKRAPLHIVPHFFLTVEKLWLLAPIRQESPTYYSRGLEELAATMGVESESPYLYAEFLALSSVYDHLLASPNRAKLKAIRETYDSIGRADRFSALEAALAYLPDDRSGFTREFLYLLLPLFSS